MKRWTLMLLSILLISVPAFADTGFNHDIQYIDNWASKDQIMPTPLQMELDYGSRTDGQPVYKGNAVSGVATSTASWIIAKYTYDGSNNILTKTTAYGSWDNRASLTYA